MGTDNSDQIGSASSYDVWNNQVRTCKGSTARASDLFRKMQDSYHAISVKFHTRKI